MQRVSPRRKHNFTGEFFTGKETCDTLGGGRYVAAAPTMRLSFRQQTNSRMDERTDKQMDVAVAMDKAPCGGGTNS